MHWFPDIACVAFLETARMLRSLMERHQILKSSWLEHLEPSIAEYIAAVAAGNRSQHILQIGCGITTIALAASAQATHSCLLSVHYDKEEQDRIQDQLEYLGIGEYVKFITDNPRNVLPTQDEVDFAFISGDPEIYIELFDSLKLSNQAIVIADNALDVALDEYLRHVRRQPGVQSKSLPIGRGIEVTKILSSSRFIEGRIYYMKFDQEFQVTMNGLNQEKHICKIERFTDNNQLHSPVSYDILNPGNLDGFHELRNDVQHNVYTTDSIEFFKNSNRESDAESSENGAETDSGYRPLTVNESNSFMKRSIQDYPTEGVTSSDKMKLQTCCESQGNLFSITEHLICNEKRQSSGDSDVFYDFADAEMEDTTNIETVQASNGELPKPTLDKSDNFSFHFQNQPSHTHIMIKGPNRDKLLADITTALNEMGISVQNAKISTQDDCIEDVFCVIDSKTQGPVDPETWSNVEHNMSEKIIPHH